MSSAIRDSLVIIPTYNEKENILDIIPSVMSIDDRMDILIVDDGSPDGTANLVKGLQKTDFPDRLHILERAGKQGLGTAYLTGFAWAIERGYDYCFEMDADFSHSPSDLPRLLAPLESNEAQMTVGSRYTKGGKVKNWPKNRLFLSFGASLYVRMITWMPVKDPTAGFVAYRIDALRQLDLSKIEFVGYAFQIEMKFAMRQLGFKIKEVPITFVDRTKGVSKMSGGIISEAIFGVIKMKLKSYKRKYNQQA